jgi:beta-glucosidase
MLNYISKHYTGAEGIPIWITENGMGVAGEASLTLEQQVDDTVRQTYYAGYVEAMLQAIIEDGVKVGGYMAWSLME